MSNKLLKVGLLGSVITALCCFTPILVGVLSVFGLGVIISYLDFVLLPLLAVFIVLTIVGFIRYKQN
jgi:mercuric ion transport protein